MILALHILNNKMIVKHQNKEISKLSDNKIVALGTQRHEIHLQVLLSKVTLTSL